MFVTLFNDSFIHSFIDSFDGRVRMNEGNFCIFRIGFSRFRLWFFGFWVFFSVLNFFVTMWLTSCERRHFYRLRNRQKLKKFFFSTFFLFSGGFFPFGYLLSPHPNKRGRKRVNNEFIILEYCGGKGGEEREKLSETLSFYFIPTQMWVTWYVRASVQYGLGEFLKRIITTLILICQLRFS